MNSDLSKRITNFSQEHRSQLVAMTASMKYEQEQKNVELPSTKHPSQRHINSGKPQVPETLNYIVKYKQISMATLASMNSAEPITLAGGTSQDKQKEGGEIVRGADVCYQHTMDLLEELGFPKGVMPLKDMVECGLVRSTGFVWMNLKTPFEHFFTGTNTRVTYAKEVTAYVEKGRMKKMTGVKSKSLLLWVPIVEMSSVNDGRRIYFKTAVGIGRSFPTSAFEEKANKGELQEEL